LHIMVRGILISGASRLDAY